MEERMERVLAALRASFNDGDIAPLREHLAEDVVLDWTLSDAPDRGLYDGHQGLAGFFAARAQAFSFRELHWSGHFARGNCLAAFGQTIQRGQASGAEVRAASGMAMELDGDRIVVLKMLPTIEEARRWVRLRCLEKARLYFVSDAVAGVDEILDAALRGGADVVQLREKSPRCEEELVSMSDSFRRAAAKYGALFFINDRPDLVTQVGADGVHVGQADETVAAARAQAGNDALVGLSTHERAQLDAAEAMRGAARPDYVSVGPVWETPTKEGRPAAGIEYVRYAAQNASLPWFAIGGIEPSNIAEVTGAGAARVVVVRAIRDAADPAAVARELRAGLPDVPSYEKVPVSGNNS
jgi:thiamine-phosphate pyrophosphorylase